MDRNRRPVWITGTGGEFTAPKPVVEEADWGGKHLSLSFDSSGALWCAWEEFPRGSGPYRVRATKLGSKTVISVGPEGERSFSMPTIAANGGLIGVAYQAGHDVAFRILAEK